MRSRNPGLVLLVGRIAGTREERVQIPRFNHLGSTFCDSARELLPDIVLHSESGHFINLFRLFMLWNSRIESETLLRQKKDLDQRLRTVDNKFIEPFGAK